MSAEQLLTPEALAMLDADEVRRLASAAIQGHARIAREDFNEFARFVIRDETTRKPIKQAWMHEEWDYLRHEFKRLVIIAHVEAGKTVQFSSAVPLHVLGRNPNKRIAVISRTQGQAAKVIRTCAQYIEGKVGPELHYTFPGLRPGTKWTDTQLFVDRDPGIREPSLQALGIGGAIMGARIDLVILDDVLDSKNTRTQDQRDQVYNWFFQNVDNRLSADGQIVFIGNAWHPDDLYCRLERLGWPTYRFPVLVDAELAERYPEQRQRVGKPTWPERWPISRIEQKRKGPPPLPPIEFARAYMCISRDDADARFKREWIEACLERGDGIRHYSDLETMVRACMDERIAEIEAKQVEDALWADDPSDGIDYGVRVYTGVDLSTGRNDGDLSCLFTIGVWPNGDRQVLNVESGRWQVDEICRRIINVHRRWGGLFLVENNAAQDYIVQIISKETTVPVFPFTTGRQKADPELGVEVLAGELANEKWIIPSRNGEAIDHDVAEWIKEMLFYKPDPRAHTGDRLMASWFARTLAYRHERKQKDSVGFMVLGSDIEAIHD